MNYLGHAYLTRNHPELIAGNFAGDSYKGRLSKFDHLPKNILDGVKLHRFIDHFTDRSEHLLAVSRLLNQEGIKRITFIAIDILIDHYLAKNWKNYHGAPYPEFIEWVYSQTDPYLNQMDEEFDMLYYRVKKYGWMFDYAHEDGIQNILRQFSKRIPFENNLTETFTAYKKHEETFSNHFANFLIEIDQASDEFIFSLQH